MDLLTPIFIKMVSFTSKASTNCCSLAFHSTRMASLPVNLVVSKSKIMITGRNQQYLTMALSYIEIGKIASKSNSSLKKTSDFQNAIAYQLFHSIELFYKFMLANKGITKKIHALSKLEEEYRKIYTEEKYKIEHPFNFSDYKSCYLNHNEDELVARHFEKFSSNYMDQHLRYPANKNTGGYSYNIDPSIFERVEKKFIFLASC